MADNNRIRSGSLQFYPRVRAKKRVPTVNWDAHSKDSKNVMGFIGYKVGMVSVFVKDNTPNSMTLGKRITVPATIVECPPMRIYSVRFYKNHKVSNDVVVSNDKELKGRIKLPKEVKKVADENDFDDVRVLAYSLVGKTGIGKKKPEIVELGISGSKEDKMSWVREHVGKDISVTEVFAQGLVDIHAVTKGFGTCGPVKRFGIALKVSKSEKGQRRPGSLAPWHPSRVTFRAPQAGQTGYHSRVAYNNFIIQSKKLEEKDINNDSGFHQYGKVKNDYLLLKGSIPGPKKREIFMTVAQRPTKSAAKKNYEVIELR
jgi:large subunit ribosomal protein L3